MNSIKYLPKNSQMMPSILCVVGKCPFRNTKPQFGELQERFPNAPQTLHVTLHGILHLIVRPRAATMARPFCNDSRLIKFKVFSNRENLAVVSNTVSQLFTTGNIARVSLTVNASCLLSIRLAEEASTSVIGTFVK